MRRRRFTFWLVLALLVLASALDHAGVFGYQGNDRDRYDGHEATIIYAADGDTIDVDIPDDGHEKTRIRLWGVDCPEIAHAKDEQDAYFGREAMEYVRGNVVGRRVRLALEPNRRARDRYGRLLAYVYLSDSGEMLNESLIDRGLAYADRRFEHVFKYSFVEREKRAAKAKAGLWTGVTSEQLPEWRQRMDAAGAR